MKHIILLMLLAQFSDYYAGAQDYSHSNPVEKVNLYTDRSLYITGENICFSATIMLENSSQDKNFSKILYVEITDQKNYQVRGKKFLISNSKCTGLIEIPEDLSTGIYYIKSYTKYMRSYRPESFSYNQIKLINPSQDDIQFEDTEVKNQQTNYIIKSGDNDYDIFDIETNKNVYRQLDSILIKIIPKIHRDSLKSTCISVVPAYSSHHKVFVINRIDKQTNDFKFEPEYHGITLTGLLLENNSNQALPSRKLDLTILGNESDFISVYTNSTGRFFFPLPELTGQKNIFISTEKSDSVMPSILVDNDFCPRSINIPYQMFMLSENEQVTALNLARNFQISEGFASGNTALTNESDNRDHGPFYGYPTETLNLDDYVQLPTLEDYFKELPYLVKVRTLQGEKYLKILGSSPGIHIYEPLVLIDMVAVYDIDAILSVSSKHISHIDIINEPYVKGNMTYGGIVSIISKNNDFAGIDLPQYGIFITYEFLSGSTPFNSDPGGNTIPDARNTLFWNGNLQITNDTLKEISFLTGNSQGRYDIVLRGVLQNENTFSQTFSFIVE